MTTPAFSSASLRDRLKLGVEEEFQIVDRTTRALVPAADSVLEGLDSKHYVAELQTSSVEVNSDVFADLSGLSDDLVHHRSVLNKAGERNDLAVVAAGTVPLVNLSDLQITDTPRFNEMQADYELLAREQLICGTQIHIDIPHRETAIQVARRVAPYLGYFLALSASSPFMSNGSDSGYASNRTLIWSRWPTTGPCPPVKSAREYDKLIADMISTRVISDPGMIYYDVRPAANQPTLELRICDSCPSVDRIMLIAGLYRALVARILDDIRLGFPEPEIPITLSAAARWRAARFGMEGDLADLETMETLPAAEAIRRLVNSLRPQLEELGDYDLIDELAGRALHLGSSSYRQRQAYRRHGRLADVVDSLIAETAGEHLPVSNRASGGADTRFEAPFFGYDLANLATGSQAYDEAITPESTVRETYTEIVDEIKRLGSIALRERHIAIEHDEKVAGIVFRPSYSEQTQPLPVDLTPRLLPRAEYDELSKGMEQRALALNYFLHDIYTDAQIIHDGVVPPALLDRTPGFRSYGRAPAWQRVRAHICGSDLVCTGDNEWVILEDNLRAPSGVAYSTAIRSLTTRHLRELYQKYDVLPGDDAGAALRETMRAAAPPHIADAEPSMAILTGGSKESAYFEHRSLANMAGVPLLRTRHLQIRDDRVYATVDGHETAIDVLYVRIDEELLLSSTGRDGTQLREGLLSALEAGNLAIINAMGNGAGDDKAIYSLVPEMIEYYLGEKPVLNQIPTYLCAERDQHEHVLANLDSLVIKPIDGYGGSGVLIGPFATEVELEQRREELLVQPERFIAQEIVGLSTHPTFNGADFQPQHVDLRAFVHVRDDGERLTAHTQPNLLTRVAPPGSMIVNSSRGGGSKDTWVVQ